MSFVSRRVLLIMRYTDESRQWQGFLSIGVYHRRPASERSSLICNQGVTGSNPAAGTNEINRLWFSCVPQKMDARNVSGTYTSAYFDRREPRSKSAPRPGGRSALQLPANVVRAGAGLPWDIGYLER